MNNDFKLLIGYHLTDRCNLKCVSCNNFCPLVSDKTKDKPIEQIKADLLLLSKFRDNVGLISLMGGEPTLHKNLEEIVIFARELFPFSEVHIATNGILLQRLLDIKDTIIRNKITIYLTKYPFKDDANEYYQKVRESLAGCQLIEFPEGNELVSTMQCKMLSNKFVNSTDEDIKTCRMRGVCAQLANGRLYMCNCAATIDVLKNYFKDTVKIQTDGTEYVDLNTCTVEDIYDLTYERIPLLCRYCNESVRNFYPDDFEYLPWHRSEKLVEEWVENI